MSRILGCLKRGLVFVLSAPAGTGKTTLARMLKDEFSCVAGSISFTTRKPRPKEKEGIDYHYISNEEFQKKIADDEFLEYAEVFGHFYGTSKFQVEKMREHGRHVILVIDTQGAMKLKAKLDEAIYIFITPPSFEELKKRLEGRESESSEAIQMRLDWSHKEMNAAKHYDYLIVNDRLQSAYEVLRSILIAEEHKQKNILT